jgi:N-acetylglutamate synthase-like GNAT family acetyltransferase
MTVTIRPTVADDLALLTDEPLPFRIRALTAEIDGKVAGVAGISFLPNGTVVAMAELTDDMRRHKFTLHRAAVKFLADVRASGIRELVATADPCFPAAERWLRRLGFQQVDKPGADRQIWVWQCTT